MPSAQQMPVYQLMRTFLDMNGWKKTLDYTLKETTLQCGAPTSHHTSCPHFFGISYCRWGCVIALTVWNRSIFTYMSWLRKCNIFQWTLPLKLTKLGSYAQLQVKNIHRIRIPSQKDSRSTMGAQFFMNTQQCTAYKRAIILTISLVLVDGDDIL